MKSEVQVFLRFTGFRGLPEAITTRVGVQPTRTWRKGQSWTLGTGRVKARGRYRHNGWELSSGLDKTRDLDAHLRALLKRIERRKSAVRRESAAQHPDVICVVYSYGGDRPPLDIAHDVLKELAALHASVVIDLYVV